MLYILIKTLLKLSGSFDSFCFGEALRLTTDKLDSKNFYAFNPGFDVKPCSKK